MPTDLRPATREELEIALSYGLRFGKRGKATSRHSEFAAKLAAAALAEILDDAGFILMRRPPLLSNAETQGAADLAAMAGRRTE